MSTLDCCVVRDARDIADAQRLRWRVYGEEERLLPRSPAPADGTSIPATTIPTPFT
jgi:hypothetical protein